MNTFKKLAKKPIAVILALVIITGTLAVAFAAGENLTVSTRTEFYKLDNGEWVKASHAKVKPGDEIRADVYLTSSAMLGGNRLLLMYDSEALTFDGSKHSKTQTMGGLDHYLLPSYDDSFTGDLVDDQANWLTVIHGAENVGAYKALDVTVDNYVTMQFNDTKMFYFYFKVNQDYFANENVDLADRLNKEGILLLDLDSKSTSTNRNYPTQPQLYKGDVEGATPDQISSRQLVSAALLNLTLDTESDSVLFAGTVTLDAIDGYGTVNINGSSVVTGDLQGFYGTAFSEDDAEVTTTDYKFIGWSTEPYSGTAAQVVGGKTYYGGDYSKIVEDYSTITYNFDDPATADVNEVTTLYAVYSDADTKYTVKVYTPDLDDAGKELKGTYTLAGTYADNDGTVNETVTAADAVKAAWIPDGFQNDSTASITLVADATQNVLEVNLTRKTKNIKWYLDDQTQPVKGGDDAPVTVYYQGNAGIANFPDPTADELNLFGKVIEWSDHEIVDVAAPTADDDTIIVRGSVENAPINVRIDAQDTTNNVTGTWAGQTDPVYDVPDVKYEDTLEDSVASNLTLPTGYDSVIYKYKDKDGNEQTANALSQLPAFTADNYTFADDYVVTINVEYVPHAGVAKFDANGGSFFTTGTDPKTVDEVEYSFGQVIAEHAAPENAKKDDADGYEYEFLGWADSADATAPNVTFNADGPTYGTTDPTYYAVWKDNRINIKFIGENGQEISSIKRDPGTNGYTLTDDDVPTVTSTDTGKEWKWNLPTDALTADAEVRGEWVNREFTLTYYVDGDQKQQTQVEYTAQMGSYDPGTVEGKTFDGWYTDSTYTTKDEYNEGNPTMPGKNVDRYGRFNANPYTLTYYVDGQQDGEPVTLKFEDPITLKDYTPADDGYEFSGWKKDADCTEDFDLDKMPAGDVPVYGKLTPKQYNIVFTKEQGGAEIEGTRITQDYKTPITASLPDGNALGLGDETKTFVKWSEDQLPETMGKYTDTVAGVENAKEIYAIYNDVEQVTLTYTHKDGTTETRTGYPNTNITNAPTITAADELEGYTAAWSETFDKFPAESKSISVTYNAKPVTVTLDPNDGTSSPTEQEVPFDQTVTEPTQPTNGNADFDGWYLPDGTKFDFSKRIKDQTGFNGGTLELKAKFSVTDNYYIATGVNNETGEFTYGDEAYQSFKHDIDDAETNYTAPTIPKMTGFTAKFWSLDKTADSTAETGTWADASRDFYALYEINKHTVTYNSDGAEYGKFENVVFGSEVPRPETDPTKEGYVFAGWKDAEGNAPGNYPTMPDQDLVFEAQFIVPGADYTLTFFDRDGHVYHTGTAHSGEPIPEDQIPDDPTRFGFIFKGWDPEIPDVMPEENLEFNAIWEIDPTFVAIAIGGTVVSGAVIGGVAAANTALITGAVIGGTALVVGGIVLAKHTHKVTFLVDGETYRVFYVVEGTKIFVPKDPSKDGATFNGWTPEIPDAMPDHDLTFEATWAGEPAPVDSVIPDTGSAVAGVAAFAVIASATAAAYVVTRKKKEDEE